MTAMNQPKFDPDYVATLREVLDIAVEQIAMEHRTPATKAMMANTTVAQKELIAIPAIRSGRGRRCCPRR